MSAKGMKEVEASAKAMQEVKRLEDATASLGERSITPYMRSKAENVRGWWLLQFVRLEDATLLLCGLGQGTVFQTAIGDSIHPGTPARCFGIPGYRPLAKARCSVFQTHREISSSPHASAKA